jgi:hypothetical protein
MLDLMDLKWNFESVLLRGHKRNCPQWELAVTFLLLDRIGKSSLHSPPFIHYPVLLIIGSGTVITPQWAMSLQGCIQMFPDWPPGARTENGTALCQ